MAAPTDREECGRAAGQGKHRSTALRRRACAARRARLRACRRGRRGCASRVAGARFRFRGVFSKARRHHHHHRLGRLAPPGPLSQWRAPSPRTTARIPVRPPSIGRPRRRCWLSISSLPSHPSSSKPSCTAAVPPAQRRLFAPYQNPPARPPAPFPSAARPAALFVLLSLRSRAVIPELFRFLPLSELAPRAAAERSSVLRAAAARPQLACLPTHRVGHAAHHPRCTSNRPFSSLHSLAICARQL